MNGKLTTAVGVLCYGLGIKLYLYLKLCKNISIILLEKLTAYIDEIIGA
jgi:hypothetical protein